MSATVTPPVFRISFDAPAGLYYAEINSLSGGIKALTINGQPLVETYADGEEPPLAAGAVLAPWPNRIEDGRYTWQGKHHQLTINEPPLNNAIHGLVHTAVWDCVDHTDDSVTLSTDITPRPGWDWHVNLTATYRLDADGLHADYTATNLSEGTVAPYAFGLHTYLSARGAHPDDCQLTVPVTHHHPLNERNLPTGDVDNAEDVIPGVTHGASIAGTFLDDCFSAPGATTLTADYVGPEGGVRLAMGPGLTWVQMFTPDDDHGCPYPGRGRALAVEPMSAPPNAFNSGTNVAKLQPNNPLTHSITLSAI